MSQLKCGVIGVGYLGQFHAEKFAKLPNAELVGVCDIDPQQCQTVAARHHTQAFNDYRDLIGLVDAVSIVVPTQLHCPITEACLNAGVHVLVEKPIAPTIEEAERMTELARQPQTVFQVGHLERFNPAVKASDTFLNHPKFIESERLAPFKLRGTEVNVVLDLMIHDIDIIQDLIHSPVKEIKANGAPVLSSSIDIANARIEFENGCVANVKASRVSLKSERKLRIFQPDAYLGLDLKNCKLAVHRKGEREMYPGIPEIVSEEQAFDDNDALMDEIESFVDAVIHNKTPVVSGEDAVSALKTALEITHVVTEQVHQLIEA